MKRALTSRSNEPAQRQPGHHETDSASSENPFADYQPINSLNVMQMQRMIGNAATKRLLQHNLLQRENAGDADVDGTPTAVDIDPVSDDDYRKRIMKDLLDGKYTHKGAFTTKEETIEGNNYQIFDAFIDPDLAFLLNYYLQKWSPRVEKKKAMGGDSYGKGVIDHPAWVMEFQQQLMGQHAATDKVTAPKNDDPYADDPFLKWDEQSEGAQRLVEAYLNAWVVKGGSGKRTASSVEEFIHNVGVSQTNDQAALLGGRRSAYDWCAASAARATVLGLMRRGLRFKGPQKGEAPVVAPSSANTGKHLEAFVKEMTRQSVRFQAWGGELSDKATKKEKQNAQREAAAKGRLISGKDAWTAELKPGDTITIIFGGSMGPISGHMATVVKEDLIQPKESLATIGENTDFSRVAIVSGNAAGVNQGESAVRIESFIRQRPPDSYPAIFEKMVGDANIYQYQVKKNRDKALAKAADKRTDDDKALIKRGDELLKKDYPVHRTDGGKFKPGEHAPTLSDRGWILGITRTSILDANSMVNANGEADAEALAANNMEVFDEASLTSESAGLNRLYPNVLSTYE